MSVQSKYAKPDARGILNLPISPTLTDLSLHSFAAMHQDMSELIQSITFLSLYDCYLAENHPLNHHQKENHSQNQVHHLTNTFHVQNSHIKHSVLA